MNQVQQSNTWPQDPTFINFQVIVERQRLGGYAITYYQKGEVVPDSGYTVRDADVVVNYQLIAPTPDEIRFSGMSRRLTERYDPVLGAPAQLSQASISLDGKMLTFSDSNSVPGKVAVTFYWTDGVAFQSDPEIINLPGGRTDVP